MISFKEEKPKILVIVGPTACGKTALALRLAKKFNGEILSADSRQVYKKMRIGTDRPKGEWKEYEGKKRYLVEGVPHYFMDIVEPDQEFTLADFKKQAREIIEDITERGKLPIVVGGTGLYVSGLVDNWDIPNAPNNKEIRKKLEEMSLAEMVELLKEKDPESAKVIDLKNPRRVIRALEVFLSTGHSFSEQRTKSKPLYEVLQIGIKRDREEIYNRINKRVDLLIGQGLVDEVKSLAKDGYDWNLPSMSGLGYRQFKEYLEGKEKLEEAVEKLKKDTRHYAKRQLTWFKRDERIKWIESGDYKKAANLVRTHLKNF